MSEHMDNTLTQGNIEERESFESELPGMAARFESTASPTQEIGETSTEVMDTSIFHCAGSEAVPSGLNGGGGQVGGELESSSDRARARDGDVVFFPQSRDPPQVAPSLLLPGYGSGYSIAGSPVLPTGAGLGRTTDNSNAAAASFGQTSGCGFAGVVPNGGSPGFAAAGLYEHTAVRPEIPTASFSPRSFGGFPLFHEQSCGGARGGERLISVPESEWREYVNRAEQLACSENTL